MESSDSPNQGEGVQEPIPNGDDTNKENSSTRQENDKKQWMKRLKESVTKLVIPAGGVQGNGDSDASKKAATTANGDDADQDVPLFQTRSIGSGAITNRISNYFKKISKSTRANGSSSAATGATTSSTSMASIDVAVNNIPGEGNEKQKDNSEKTSQMRLSIPNRIISRRFTPPTSPSGQSGQPGGYNLFGATANNLISRLHSNVSTTGTSSTRESLTHQARVDMNKITSAVMKRAANARYYLPAHLLKKIGAQKHELDEDTLIDACRRVYDPTTPIHLQGYLDKQSFSNINQWKKRYLVLKDAGLFWFHEQSEFLEKKPPKGLILFMNVFGDIDSGDYMPDDISTNADIEELHHKDAVRYYPINMKNLLGKAHVFAIMHVKSNGQDRSFFFSHPDAEETQKWAKAVEDAYHHFLDSRDGQIVSATSAMRGKPIPLSMLHDLHQMYDEFVENTRTMTVNHIIRKIFLVWYLQMKDSQMLKERTGSIPLRAESIPQRTESIPQSISSTLPKSLADGNIPFNEHDYEFV